MYITYVKEMTSPSLIHEIGHWDNPEGWGEEGRGGGVGTATPIADSCQCMAKTTTILQSN